MKKWKLITLISSLVLISAVTVALILIFNYQKKDTPDYHYPTVIPTISDKDDTYITLGSRNITNEEIYNMAIITYGLTSLNDLIDQKLLPLDEVTDEELIKRKTELYASINEVSEDEVDLADESQGQKFKEQMALQGFYQDATIDLILRLDIARQKMGKESLIKEIASYKPTKSQPIYFTENQIRTAAQNMESLSKQVKALIIPFRSESEVKKLLKDCGIDVNHLNNGWQYLDGTKLTKEEIIDVYLTMYNKIYDTSLTDEDIPLYTMSELNKVSSTIANNVFNNLVDLDEATDLKNAYVYNPVGKSYITNYYYLALRLETVEQFNLDEFYEAFKNDTLSGAYLELYEKLVADANSSSYINQLLYQMRYDHGIQIYDERLDISYYAESYSAIGDLYQLTATENESIVADGDGFKVTADELKQEMFERYGAIIAMQFANFYTLFNDQYSTVYNFETKTKLADYQTAYDDAFASLKESLEAGEFESYGYSRYYGFANFVRDYTGLTYPDDALCVLDPYDLALNSYSGSTVYPYSDATDELYAKFNEAYIEHSMSVDGFHAYFEGVDDTIKNSLVYKIIEQFDSFFSIKASTITYFVDHVGSGSGVEMNEEERASGELLVNAILYLAKNNPTKMDLSSEDLVYQLAQKIFKAMKNRVYEPYNDLALSTLKERMVRLITIYNLASLDDEIFGPFKALHIRLSYTTDTTYYYDNINEAARQPLRDLWLSVLNESLALDNGTYAYFERTKEINSSDNALKAVGISDDTPYLMASGIVINDKVTRFIVTEVVNTTWYNFSDDGTSRVTNLLPPMQRLEMLYNYYAISLIESENRTYQQQSIYESSTPVDFEAPYVTNILGPAYDALIDSTLISNRLNDLRITLLENKQIAFTSDSNKECALMIMHLLSE